MSTAGNRPISGSAPCPQMVTSISAFRCHLLYYHTESLSLRGGIVAYLTIPPADAHRRVVLDSVRQGGRAAFRRRLRQEMTSATPPTAGYSCTVPSATSDLRPADYKMSTGSGSSLSSGGLTNDTEYNEEFGLDWFSVDLPDLTRARVESVRPAAPADLNVPMELQRFAKDWDDEPDVHVERYISPNIPVVVVPTDRTIVVDVPSPPRQPTPPPEPFPALQHVSWQPVLSSGWTFVQATTLTPSLRRFRPRWATSRTASVARAVQRSTSPSSYSAVLRKTTVYDKFDVLCIL